MVTHEQAQTGQNGQKCLKIAFSGKWRENWVIIAWSSSLFTDIIATATSDNIFVNKSGGGIERSPMSRHKQGKMAKNV